MEPGGSFGINGLVLEAVEARHSETDGVGVRVSVPEVGDVGYTSDTGFFEGLGGLYSGVRVLIACAMWPRKEHLRYHLNADEVRRIVEEVKPGVVLLTHFGRIVEEVKPGVVLLTHFGMKMVNAGPEEEAAYIEEETGVPAVAARDGMRVIVGEGIEVSGPRKSEEPRLIDA
jgi:ribonuclease BN (tRNA processing enzyme)